MKGAGSGLFDAIFSLFRYFLFGTLHEYKSDKPKKEISQTCDVLKRNVKKTYKNIEYAILHKKWLALKKFALFSFSSKYAQN